MAKVPECGCGCGTELKQRKDGTYANYAPGGHDAKHKSALVKAARDGDKKALDTLKKKGWEKFLEKGKKKTTEEIKKTVKKSTQVAPAYYGMSEFEVAILTNPPTAITWYCPDDHSGFGRIMVAGTSDECWFCHAKRTDDSELAWPHFEAAMDKLRALDWERIYHDARVDERMSMMNRPEVVQVARDFLKLKARHIDNMEPKVLKEEDGTIYA